MKTTVLILSLMLVMMVLVEADLIELRAKRQTLPEIKGSDMAAIKKVAKTFKTAAKAQKKKKKADKKAAKALKKLQGAEKKVAKAKKKAAPVMNGK